MLLDLMCAVLLAAEPELLDAAGLRFLRWACRHLQVRRCCCWCCRCCWCSWAGMESAGAVARSSYALACCPLPLMNRWRASSGLMQGGRVKQNSPYWQVYTDCGTVLRHSRQLQQQGRRQPGQPAGRAGAVGSHLSRLSLRHSLTGIAGTVARIGNARPPA